MQRIIDLSLPLEKEMITYPGDPAFELGQFRCHNKDKYQSSYFKMSCHGGTHADAPAHFIENGKDISQIPIEHFVGKAYVCDAVILDGAISTRALQSALSRKGSEKILILRTGWEESCGKIHYFTDHPYFEGRISNLLKEYGIVTIAVDMPSVTNKNGTIDMHLDLLENDITIIESLVNLKDLTQQRVFFSGVPLRISGSDASPIRAYAISN